MHSELQGNNYFLLPSSVTLPAGPSLETFHGDTGAWPSMREWEGESVRLKEYDVYNTNRNSRLIQWEHKVWRVLGRLRLPWGAGMFLCRAWYASCEVTWYDMHDAVFNQAGCGHLGMAGTRRPFSSMKWPPALSTQRWWRDIRACLAVVGVSFPSWLSAFFSGENSSSLSTSYTTNVLLDTDNITSADRPTQQGS